MRIIITILFLITSTLTYAWDQKPPLPIDQCKNHSPYGWAQTQKNLIPICRTGYLSAFDSTAKIPNYVSYTLEPKNALGCIPRTNAFVADISIPNGPKPDDYTGTGYDKGHAAPDGDMSFDQQVEFESFLMTNMFPQHGSLNRGIWKLLETAIRGWTVQRNQSYTIYVGAIYNINNPVIGNGVKVPNAYYKIVINNATKEVAGWLFPHVAPYGNLGNDLTKFRVPVGNIMQQANIQFMFPNNAIEIQPGKEWAVDFGMLTAAKRQKCGKSE